MAKKSWEDYKSEYKVTEPQKLSAPKNFGEFIAQKRGRNVFAQSIYDLNASTVKNAPQNVYGLPLPSNTAKSAEKASTQTVPNAISNTKSAIGLPLPQNSQSFKEQQFTAQEKQKQVAADRIKSITDIFSGSIEKINNFKEQQLAAQQQQKQVAADRAKTIQEKADAFVKAASPAAYMEDSGQGWLDALVAGPAQERQNLRKELSEKSMLERMSTTPKTGQDFLNKREYLLNAYFSLPASTPTDAIDDFLVKFGSSAGNTGAFREDRDKAKAELYDGLTQEQAALADIGLAATDMGNAVAFSAMTGGLVPPVAIMGGRQGSLAAEQALKEGKDSGTAAAYGALSGATTAATERLGGVFGGSKTASAVKDKLLNKLPSNLVQALSKVTSSKIGQVATTALEEGAEEALEYPAQWALENLILDKNTPYDVKEQAYNALIGGAVGGMFGGANALKTTMQQGAIKATQQAQLGNTYSTNYTPQEADMITKESDTFRNLVNGKDTTLRSFFNRWKNDKKTTDKLEKLYLGKTTPIASKKISELLGYEVGSRDFIITNNDIRHIFKSHGDPVIEKSRGQLPVDSVAIEKLPEILQTPDDVYLGDLDRIGKQGIVFKKAFADGTIFYIQTDNKGRNTLQGKTLYITKKKDPTSISGSAQAAPELTSLTVEPESFNPIIAQTAPNINTKNIGLMISTKAQVFEFKQHQAFSNNAAKALSFGSSQVSTEAIAPIMTEISMELKKAAGKPLSEQKAGELFEKAYAMAGVAQATANNPADVNAKTIARYEFDKALDTYSGQLGLSYKYIQDKNQKRQTTPQTAQPQANIDTLKQAYSRTKAAEREQSKVVAANVLTEKDNIQVDRLLKGEITPDELPRGSNVGGIMQVYAAKKALADARAPIESYNVARKTALKEQAMDAIAGSDLWKDKKIGFAYSRETMERNIRDIVPNKAEADAIIKTYFEPVHVNEARATRLKNELRDTIRPLKLNQYESAYVQMKGEMDDLKARSAKSAEAQAELENLQYVASEYLNAYGKRIDMAKVERAIPVFRSAYNTLFELTNDALISNGYDPMDFRSGYFPHFTEDKPDTALAKLAKKTGIQIDSRELPTDIAGLTHTFRPGKRWFSAELSREGFKTDYNALFGFDRYIESAADIIYHTDDIQRLRTLENTMRYKYSSKGMREEIDAVGVNSSLSSEQKQSLLNDLYARMSEESKAAHLPHFATEIRSYTDTLAGKKSLEDRVIEHQTGRLIYSVSKALEGRIAANMVAINPASWITNFIPLTQGGAQLKAESMLAAARDTVKAFAKDDGFADRSSFLTNRRGSEMLNKSAVESASEFMTKPMFLIDDFTSNVLTRARYYQNVKNGMSEETAVSDADAWAASVIADRSKGALPTTFNVKNPISKVFTMFQVEANNQLSHLFKDIPREAKERGAAWLAWTLTKYFVWAYLYNDLYEYFIGRRPALDTLGIVNQAVGDITGYEAPNIAKAAENTIQGLPVSFETQKSNASAAIGTAFGSAAQQFPFVGGLLEGGRYPISSALPNDTNPLAWAQNKPTAVGSIVQAASGEKPWNVALATAGKELAKPGYYLLPPFGGGQIKKAVEGISTVAGGGSYSLDNQGREVLDFPVYNQGFGEYAQASAFGKFALPTGRDYVESGFKKLSAANTAAYKEAINRGISQDNAYEIIKQLSEQPNQEQKIKALAAYKGLSATSKNWLHTQVISDKTTVDYTNVDTIALSQLTEAKQKGYATVSGWIGVKAYVKAVSMVSGMAKKESIIKRLKGAGYNQRAAEMLYQAFRGGEK